jgi:catechol 2,3-dioxygenase-like lactoylglutathione lyase family enzyme
MESRISIITLGVADLERSTRFYRDGLGLPLHDRSNDAIAFFKTSGTWLALFPRDALAADAALSPSTWRAKGLWWRSPRGEGFQGFTLAHNVRTREEVQRVLEDAQAAGAKIVKPAAATSWGGYSGYFADPDGFLWEIAWNPNFWVE